MVTVAGSATAATVNAVQSLTADSKKCSTTAQIEM